MSSNNDSGTRRRRRPIYGQVVVGPPGSGKTTYCDGMQQYLRLLGRKAYVINLDPANEVGVTQHSGDPPQQNHQEQQDASGQRLPYDALVDVCQDIVDLSSVMEQCCLGPNGGLLYCMEYLEAHVDALIDLIRERIEANRKGQDDEEDDVYLLFDFPGQIELTTDGASVPQLLRTLTAALDLRLCAVNLIDGQFCTDAAKFLSAALISTMTMIRLELPSVNLLSKVDLLSQYGEESLPFSMEFFTEAQDLTRLVPYLDAALGSVEEGNDSEMSYADDPDYQRARQRVRSSVFFRKHAKLHEALAEVVEDYGLLSFLPLEISNAESVGRVLARIDKSNGYIFASSSSESNTQQQDLFQCAVQSEASNYESVADIQERLSTKPMTNKEAY